MGDNDQTFFDEVATDEEQAPKQRRPRRRKALIGISAVLVLALLIVGGMAVYYGKALNDALGEVQREPGMMPSDDPNRPEPVPTPEGASTVPMNFVLMGSDSQDAGDRGRSDVLIILHVPADREAAYLISIPRDYWVEIPGHGQAKINAAYAYGGSALTVRTVEDLLAVPMDHAVLVDFEGFIRMVDAVGGVTVNNRYESSSGEHHFPKGEVTLNGDEALAFVRERKDLPNGDFDRAERQRDVIRAIVSKMMSRGVLTQPNKFRDVVTGLGRNFTVDEGFTDDEIVDLATSMRITSGADIKSFMVPVGEFGTSSDGQSYVAVDEAGIAELQEALRNDTVAEYVANR